MNMIRTLQDVKDAVPVPADENHVSMIRQAMNPDLSRVSIFGLVKIVENARLVAEVTKVDAEDLKCAAADAIIETNFRFAAGVLEDAALSELRKRKPVNGSEELFQLETLATALIRDSNVAALRRIVGPEASPHHS